MINNFERKMTDPKPALSLEDISILDKQVEQLQDFKPIPENEVKMLCDKVKSKLLRIRLLTPDLYWCLG